MGLAMLQLAEVGEDVPGYDLVIDFSQPAWIGGIGAFVRGRTINQAESL